MKAKIYFLNIVFAFLIFNACESDDALPQQAFVIAFEKQSYDYSLIAGDKEMKLVFSEKAKSSGSVIVKINAINATYGTDFSTYPTGENQLFEVPFNEGQTEVIFTFKNLVYPFDTDDDDKKISFEISKINYSSETAIQGYKMALVSFGKSLGATLLPEIGGPNQGSQVYIDLSTELMTKVQRDSWDLGFYGGSDFRVAINGSLYMAVKNLNVTNIDAVTPVSVQSFQSQVAMGTFDPANVSYIDAPIGNITQTAIATISENDNENQVYLVNMGYQIGTTTPAVGSAAVAGNARGWKKIRILKRSENYLLQYADLNSTTHQEVTISKNPSYNFTFFSFNTQSIVNVEPEKTKWDLNFTVFTNEIVGSGSYGYSDFVVNNLKAGVKAYRVNTSSFSYANFTLANVKDTEFTNDQRIIGAEWRDVFSSSAYSDRFYVLKDADSNYYAIRMLALVDSKGVRGYPKFEYKLLQ
jgi:hypothetical protein